MRRWSGLLFVLFALFVVGLLADASAQIARPAATPRAAATPRPAATVRIPAGAGEIPTGNLVIWMKGDAGVYSDAAGTTAVTSDAERVRSWQDQSTNGYLFVESSSVGADPNYQTSELNGEPCVYFDGSGRYFEKTGVTDLLSNATEVTFAVVMKVKSGIGSLPLSQDEGGGSTDKWFFAHNAFGVSGVHLNGVSGSLTMSYSTAFGVDYEMRVFRRKSDNTWVWRRNSGADGSGTNATLFSMPNTGPLQIGSAEGGNSGGHYCEIILYGAALSDDDLTTLETYLDTKYFP